MMSPKCWIDVDGASHTLSATAAIFSGVRTGFSRFGLSMRTPVSFTFFSQNNEHTEQLKFDRNLLSVSKRRHYWTVHSGCPLIWAIWLVASAGVIWSRNRRNCSSSLRYIPDGMSKKKEILLLYIWLHHIRTYIHTCEMWVKANHCVEQRQCIMSVRSSIDLGLLHVGNNTGVLL